MNREEKLKELLKQREEYRYIVEKLFDDPLLLSEEEKILFMEENRTQIEELKVISDEISKIKWDLMSPEEKEKYLDKYSDD